MSYAFPLHVDWHCLCGDSAASHNTKADGESCYGHCQRTPKDCRGFGYRPIEHSGRTPAISAIFEAAGSSEEHWPKHYTCDLSTDYQLLLEYDGPFIWILREMGTELYRLEQPEPDARTWQRGYVQAALKWQAENHASAHVFYWNPSKGELAPVNYDTALTIAATYLAPRTSSEVPA